MSRPVQIDIEPFLIFKLPTELRLRILFFACKRKKDLRGKLMTEDQNLNVSLLAASRKLHEEALPIFYRCNIFRIDIYHSFIPLPSWVIEPTANMLAYIRHIHIHVTNVRWQLSSTNRRSLAIVIKILNSIKRLESLKVTIEFDTLVKASQLEKPFGQQRFDEEIAETLYSLPVRKEIILEENDHLDMQHTIKYARSQAQDLKRKIREKRAELDDRSLRIRGRLE